MVYNRPEIVHTGAAALHHLLSNLVYAFFSPVYEAEEAHFIAASYVDPVSAVFVFIGLGCFLRAVRKDRFALFFLLTFALLLFLAGASHDRYFPPATRMHLLLPWFALSAALGLAWLCQKAESAGVPRFVLRCLAVLLFAGVIAINLYQAYVLSPWRLSYIQLWEPLYVRIAQRAQEIAPDPPKTFLFLTGPRAEIYGPVHYFQPVYGVPPSTKQLVKVKATDPQPPATLLKEFANRDVLVLFWQDFPEAWLATYERALRESGKIPCPVKTVRGEERFLLWQSPKIPRLCD